MKNSISTKVFYIDDDQDDLDFFKTVANELGISVEFFNKPDHLYQVLDNPPPIPSMIFVDLNMPIKSGFELITELRGIEKFKNLPLIAYSTSSNPENVKRCRSLGATMYVVKPMSMAELKLIINHLTQTDWEAHVITDKNFLFKSKQLQQQ